MENKWEKGLKESGRSLKGSGRGFEVGVAPRQQVAGLRVQGAWWGSADGEVTPSPALPVSPCPREPLPSRRATMDEAPLPAPPVPAPAPAPAPPAAAPRVPFHCSECGKSFRYRSDLRRHFARHTALKPHACPRCGKGFKHSFNLANHLRSHTGERPYRCSACPKGFRDSTGLLHHQVSPAGRPLGRTK